MPGNGIRGFLLQDGVRDTGCSLKLFRRDDYLTLPYFNHMHRFLPALFQREYGQILLVDVSHRPPGTRSIKIWFLGPPMGRYVRYSRCYLAYSSGQSTNHRQGRIMFTHHLIDMFKSWDSWVLIGFIGQFMFTMRFVMQCSASEKARKSVMPYPSGFSVSQAG